MTDLEKALVEFNRKADKLDVLFENILGLETEVKEVKNLAAEVRALVAKRKDESDDWEARRNKRLYNQFYAGL